MADMISIVIPVYNGENSLIELYQNLKKELKAVEVDFEVIFIDDNSSDQSYKKILSLNNKDKKVKGIQLAANFGQQNAIFCGLNYCQGDYIVTMDDDLQHSPSDISKLYFKIKEGYDVVYAVPQNQDHKLYRKLGSKLTNKLFNLITPKTNEIKVSSFRIMNQKTLKKVIKTNKSFIYLSAIILKTDAAIANLDIKKNKRKYGKSNYNLIKLSKLFLKLYLYYAELPFLKYFRSAKKQYRISKSTFND